MGILAFHAVLLVTVIVARRNMGVQATAFGICSELRPAWQAACGQGWPCAHALMMVPVWGPTPPSPHTRMRMCVHLCVRDTLRPPTVRLLCAQCPLSTSLSASTSSATRTGSSLRLKTTLTRGASS